MTLRKLYLALVLFSASFFAQSALIIGNTYQDTNGEDWEYVGSYNLYDGPLWITSSQTVDVMFTGLEAAELLFGVLQAGQEYALSTSDQVVNFLAWYDGYAQSVTEFSQDITVDINGDGIYNFEGSGRGDWSAYIRDHFNDKVNYVFVRDITTADATVSEPSVIGLLALGLFGLTFRRKRFL